MMNSNTLTVTVDAAAAALTRPGLLLTHASTNPVWRGITGLFVDPGQVMPPAMLKPNKILKAIALKHYDANQVHRLGFRWFAGVMTGRMSFTPVPLSGEGVQSLVNNSPHWIGEIYAPWGIAIWTFHAITNTDIVQVSYIMDGDD